MDYDMVWCGKMQKKQHKIVELKKKKKKMRTEQNRTNQNRAEQNRIEKEENRA